MLGELKFLIRKTIRDYGLKQESNASKDVLAEDIGPNCDIRQAQLCMPDIATGAFPESQEVQH